MGRGTFAQIMWFIIGAPIRIFYTPYKYLAGGDAPLRLVEAQYVTKGFKSKTENPHKFFKNKVYTIGDDGKSYYSETDCVEGHEIKEVDDGKHFAWILKKAKRMRSNFPRKR